MLEPGEGEDPGCHFSFHLVPWELLHSKVWVVQTQTLAFLPLSLVSALPPTPTSKTALLQHW